jgi:hypothetical protein
MSGGLDNRIGVRKMTSKTPCNILGKSFSWASLMTATVEIKKQERNI